MTSTATDNLRIAIVSSGLGHVARGIETWAADTARALREMGEEVTLFKGSGKSETAYERVCSGLPRGSRFNALLNRLLPGPFWRVGLGNPYDIEQTSFALGLIPRIRRRYDIVHTQDPLVALILQRARHAGLVRAPAILGHGTEEPFEFLSKIEFVQHLAPHHLEEARAAGYTREGWTAIGNFVDCDIFRPRDRSEARRRFDIPEDAFVVLSVAAIKRHHKRIDHLIEETAKFREQADPRAVLLVAGASTGDTDSLRDLAAGRLGKAFRFLTNRPRSDMPAIYNTADVFVLCSLKEMMPIALIEATASGLPCLVSTHPVVRWMAGDGGEGIEMERTGELASALPRYADPDFRAERGAAARRHAVETFGKKAIVSRYLEMYRDVIRLAQGGGQ